MCGLDFAKQLMLELPMLLPVVQCRLTTVRFGLIRGWYSLSYVHVVRTGILSVVLHAQVVILTLPSYLNAYQ